MIQAQQQARSRRASVYRGFRKKNTNIIKREGTGDSIEGVLGEGYYLHMSKSYSVPASQLPRPRPSYYSSSLLPSVPLLSSQSR